MQLSIQSTLKEPINLATVPKINDYKWEMSRWTTTNIIQIKRKKTNNLFIIKI